VARVPWKGNPNGQRPDPKQGPTIRSARMSRGWSQEKLGSLASLSQQHVSSLERGYRCASGRAAVRLASVLHVSIPLPRRLPSEHALGREEARKWAREAEVELIRRMAIPRFVPYRPPHLPRWG
jgi:transcriptional regulator with XRE-family HTH domain